MPDVLLKIALKFWCVPSPLPPIRTAGDWPGWSCSRYISATRKQSARKVIELWSDIYWHPSPPCSLHWNPEWERWPPWARGYISSWNSWSTWVGVLPRDTLGLHLLERSPSIGHLWRAGVCGSSLVLVVELAGLLEHKVSISVISVPLGQHQGKQKLKYDISVVHRVARNVGDKPVPELG